MLDNHSDLFKYNTHSSQSLFFSAEFLPFQFLSNNIALNSAYMLKPHLSSYLKWRERQNLIHLRFLVDFSDIPIVGGYSRPHNFVALKFIVIVAKQKSLIEMDFYIICNLTWVSGEQNRKKILSE